MGDALDGIRVLDLSRRAHAIGCPCSHVSNTAWGSLPRAAARPAFFRGVSALARNIPRDIRRVGSPGYFGDRSPSAMRGA